MAVFCANGERSAEIRFKYPADKDWQLIKSRWPPVEIITDLKTIEPPFQGGQVANTRYTIGFTYKNRLGQIKYQADSAFNASGYLGRIDQCFFATDTYPSGVPTGSRKYSLYIYYGVGSWGANPAWVIIGTPTTDWPASLISIQIRRKDGKPDISKPSTTECKFEVNDASGTLYSSTRAICPSYQCNCGKDCPPGTCKCKSGNRVCCHDIKTGKLVNSYLI